MDPLALRLRTEREKQGLSTRDLSVVTKIREPYIEALERGRYDVLPAVYVKSFVRTLATTLGISVTEANELMDEVFDIDEGSSVQRIPRSAPPPVDKPDVFAVTMQKAGDVFSVGVGKAGTALNKGMESFRSLKPPTFYSDRPTLIMVGAITLGVILLFVGAFYFFGGSSESTSESASTDGMLSDSLLETVITQDSMFLTAEVMDTAWLTITMDGQRTEQAILIPGEDYAWSANERFVLSLSNAGGVRFFRDGEPLPLFGQKGHAVRSVRVTRTDVISSTKTLDEITTSTRSTPSSASPPPSTPPPSRPRRAPTRRTQRQDRQTIPIITPAPTQSPAPTRKPSDD